MKIPSYLYVVPVLVAFWAVRNPDWVVTLIPNWPLPFDDWAFHMIWSDNLTNDPKYMATQPMLTYLEPVELEKKSDIIRDDGMPVLVRNFVELPTNEEMLERLIKVNKGKEMRVLDFSRHQNHVSSSCGGIPKNKTMMNFEDFATKLGDVEELYAGFETLTPIETVNEMLGFDTTTLGPHYKQNNLFFSSFGKTIMSAALHCSPIDSIAVQMAGKKTWLLASPKQLSEVYSIGLPTFFPIGFTDDTMLDTFKEFRVVEAGPGDALYFGPSWCHAVITHEGLNFMYNMRYLNPKKVRHEMTPKLFGMSMFRYFTRTFGKNPQDNSNTFGPLYNSINNHYSNCGISNRVEKMVDYFGKRWWDRK